jgi:beta-RFAP synthase
MVDQPGLDLEAEPAHEWSANGPLAERILASVQRFRRSLSPVAVCPRALHFHVRNQPLEHQGLGTGTQLALAVARILADIHELPGENATSLARRVGRGQRSAIGIHGFDHGGFLVDGGKMQQDQIAPLAARVAFPESWRIILLLFPNIVGYHSHAESEAFARLCEGSTRLATDRLCRLLLLGMLPALADLDLPAFGEALYEYNRLVGEAFRPLQRGVYTHSCAEEAVAYLRNQGITGVGQSSWGPSLFAVVENADRAAHVVARYDKRVAGHSAQLVIAQGVNVGTTVQHEPPEVAR